MSDLIFIVGIIRSNITVKIIFYFHKLCYDILKILKINDLQERAHELEQEKRELEELFRRSIYIQDEYFKTRILHSSVDS